MAKIPLFGHLEQSKFGNRSSVRAKNCFGILQKIVSSLPVSLVLILTEKPGPNSPN